MNNIAEIFKILILNRVKQIACYLTKDINTIINSYCIGAKPCVKDLQSKYFLGFLVENLKLEGTQLKSNLTLDEIFCIFDIIQSKLDFRYNLCINENNELTNSSGQVILWTDNDSIKDVSGDPYNWNNEN